ncbi:putative bifunctional diguanylate cyclase/phosphodiesterase [Pseudoduganella namucuonensis]|uniref:Diguanylate cyclase (GGDEF) domain-containing protein n=1 Tax=Pseudoduganella namucuonensis TaxID=1035707 RepID=A0A1I7M756_9BURK|nr:EAL domain-containing protein [Pseudoduganella namucuonensis]SFV17707.1 diguanylate cyclase (GGDEF) domain-containing protein [Pseudoduganella namucuonensis]
MTQPADEPEGAAEHLPLAKELARVNRALTALSAGNRTLLRATNEQQLLDDMCRVIVDTGGYLLASVGFVQPDEPRTIRWMVHLSAGAADGADEPRAWSETIYGRTATGVAIRTGEAVIGRRLLTDPQYAGPEYGHLRKHAAKLGYAAISAFPLRVDGEVLGAVAMAAADPDAFDQAEVALLGEMVDDMAYGIAALRVRVRHEQAEATIARLAFYDSLTGLPNRTRLVEQLDAAMGDARRGRHALALLHLEVGRFQEINKVLGYRAGDQLLQLLARRLQAQVRGHETLARVGEAEFALLLPDGGADYARQTAQRLVAMMREPVELAGLLLDARVGIGIALYPGHATDADSLIRRANAAMHQAAPGRGGYAMYTGGQEQENTRRLALMGDLYSAIRDNELELYCQPKVGMATRKVCGAEALVRWRHPRHGLVSTMEFIQMAEQAGTITPLTNWMMDAAFSQAHSWREAGEDWALAINLSAHDLYDPGLVDRIRGLFSTWGIPPDRIQFELTESALMTDPAAALETLVRLKRLDVKLFLDDYGTGYSSLGYLQKLPMDGIKIDKSFVTPMVSSGDSEVIVCSTIDLGHNLGLDVVAEGVEDQATWRRLEGLGCDIAQGYLISQPMPAADFPDWAGAWARAPA